jgi:hypothetical protein
MAGPVHHLLSILTTSDEMGIPARTYEYETLDATRTTGGLYTTTMPRRGDAVEPMAITVNTTGTTEETLRDIGHFRVTIGDTCIQSIPMSLISAMGSVEHTGPRILVRINFRMFMENIQMISLHLQEVRFSVETYTDQRIQGIAFVLQHTYMNNDERRALFNPTIAMLSRMQRTTSQTLQHTEPDHGFTYTYALNHMTKGFFIEGAVQDISSVVLTMQRYGDRWTYTNTEISLLAKPIGTHHVFVPFRYGANIFTMDTDSYEGAFQYAAPIQLTVTYNQARSKASTHALFADRLIYTGGMAHLPTPAGQWTYAVKPLNPERAMCPITYETITGPFCECEQCHHAFDSVAFRSYANTQENLTCPVCRTPWNSLVVYSQSNA